MEDVKGKAVMISNKEHKYKSREFFSYIPFLKACFVRVNRILLRRTYFLGRGGSSESSSGEIYLCTLAKLFLSLCEYLHLHA